MYRVVSTEEGQKKAEEEGAVFMETSAKQGYNIKPLFRKIATALPGMEKTSVPNDSNCELRRSIRKRVDVHTELSV